MRIVVFAIAGFVGSLTNFPAKADIVTFSVSGFVQSCNSPCTFNATGQISVTYDTSVAGVNGSDHVTCRESIPIQWTVQSVLATNVRSWGKSGRDLLVLSVSQFDPTRTLGPIFVRSAGGRKATVAGSHDGRYHCCR
jgi:hypothetical protein